MGTAAYVKCPGCGKHYNLADYKSDKLICSACGREIPVFVTIRDADEQQTVKQFLSVLKKKADLTGKLVGVAGLAGIAAALWFCTVSIWWKLGVSVGCFLGLVLMIKEIRYHWQVWKIFKKNNYRVEPICRHVESWLYHIPDDKKNDVPDIYTKDFAANLRNYVFSNAKIETQHKRTVDVTTSASTGCNVAHTITTQCSSYAMASSMPVSQHGKIQTYDVPPEHCPYCQALYQVADFSGKEVICRHCGRKILIRCVVTDEEISKLLKVFLKKITHSTRSIITTFAVLCPITGWLTIWLFPQPFDLENYLFSLRIIPFAFFCLCLVITIDRFTQLRRIHRIVSGKFALWKLEYFIKKDNDNDSLAAFHQFKKDLLGLYKKKQHVIKGDAL